MRVGSRDPRERGARPVGADVVAVLPQPYYRWDGNHHFHDIALLGAPPAVGADARGARRAASRAGQTAPASRDTAGVDRPTSRARGGFPRCSDRRRRPGLLRISSRRASTPPGCSAARPRPAISRCRAGRRCFGDSGGPAFASENTTGNVVVEGVISYGADSDGEVRARTSRSWPANADSSIARWRRIRDCGAGCATTRRARPSGPSAAGSATPDSSRCAIDDDRSRRSRIAIVFYARDGEQTAQAYRSIPTNRWVRLELARRSRRSSGSFCVQGTDGTKKQSNTACARDVVR